MAFPIIADNQTLFYHFHRLRITKSAESILKHEYGHVYFPTSYILSYPPFSLKPRDSQLTQVLSLMNCLSADQNGRQVTCLQLFRPLSLTCVPFKLLEYIVCGDIMAHLDEPRLL